MPDPQVRYCTTEDGVRIAYSIEGEGPATILMSSNVDSFVEQLNHGIIRDFFAHFSGDRTRVYFDHRGVGLSQRDVSEVSIDGLASDVDAVIRTLGRPSVSLCASVMSGPAAIAYAAKHPDRVSHLVLFETFGNVLDIMTAEQARSFAQLCRANWHVAAQAFADMSIREQFPDLAVQMAKGFEEGTSGDHMARLFEAAMEWDAADLLQSITAKTLVLHRRGDPTIPFSAAQKLAAGIPGARLVPLEGSFTYASLGDVGSAVEAIDAFLPKSEPEASPRDPAETGTRRTVPAPAVQPQSFSSGRYVVGRLLGEGGQKIVFLARDTQLGRDVAVALLKAEGLEEAGLARLRREAQALARLEAQPNIVAIYDIGEHEGRPFTVCEYLAGGTLEQELARAGGPLPAERAVAITRDVCHALVVAHRGDIIHRDIKPSNIWLTGAGSAKLGDFGLATALDRSRVTQAGTIMGTAAYMAPEQALGGEIDQRSDVYSLGCVLYETLTGRPPFVAGTAVAVVSQHINASPVPPSDLQRGLPRARERLVMQMLAKSQEDRPQTAAEVLAALEGNALASKDAPARVRTSPVVTEPQVRYCTTEDGVNIAYTVTGEGPAHLFVNEPMVSHVQLERDLPLFKRITDRLVSANTLIRFDPRGVGMSDRVLPTTLEESALDIRAVVDRLGLNQFALTGVQSSVLPVLFYTAHNVSQIRRVVLLDGFLRARDPSDAVQSRALASAASVDFEMATEMVGAAVFGPGREESRSYGIYIRSCIGPEFFAHAPVAATFDATPYASAVTVPALVIRHDGLQYITPEMTRDLVSRLPDARLITMPGLWADNPEGLADHVVAFIGEDE